MGGWVGCSGWAGCVPESDRSSGRITFYSRHIKSTRLSTDLLTQPLSATAKYPILTHAFSVRPPSSAMSAERNTTYHLSSCSELLQHKKAETDRRGPYHRTYDSVRVQANNRLMLSPPAPEMDRAARKVYKETVRAQVYLDAKRKHESHATTSTSMVTIVPFNGANNNHVTSTPSAASTAVTTVISTADVAAPLAPTTFRKRCQQLLGLLWWDNVDESLLPRADARRQLCRWVLSLVELKGMGSPDIPDFTMTLLLYWCQHTINHGVSHTAALTREQLQQNGQLIHRLLGVTGRSLYVPQFVQLNIYQIAGKFSDHGAAVFGLIWLFRDHWPMSKAPSCASLAEVELNTLTRYVMPLVMSCVKKRASEREWLHELCRLSLRLSPQHLEYAGTFLDDQGQTIHMRDTAFVRQLERHVYAHVKDEPAQWSLLKYIDQRELYYAHVQTKLQQQEELRFELARHQAIQKTNANDERQWLQDARAVLQEYLTHPTLREYVEENTAGPELRLLSHYNNYQDFCKRVAHGNGALASEEEEEEDVTSFKRRIKRLPRQERTLERQSFLLTWLCPSKSSTTITLSKQTQYILHIAHSDGQDRLRRSGTQCPCGLPFHARPKRHAGAPLHRNGHAVEQVRANRVRIPPRAVCAGRVMNLPHQLQCTLAQPSHSLHRERQMHRPHFPRYPAIFPLLLLRLLLC